MDTGTYQEGKDSKTNLSVKDSRTQQENIDSAKLQEGKDSETSRPGSNESTVSVEGKESKSDFPTESVTQMLNAATNGDVDAIRHLTAKAREDVLNCQDVEGRTVLMLAAGHGRNACVHFLIKDGRVFINKQDVNGQSALMMAAVGGHNACVTCLLSASGIDVKLRDKKGRTALLLASKNGHPKCVRSLYDHSKLAINSSDWEKESKLAFFLAVMKGQTDCVRHLFVARTKQAVCDFNLELGSAIVLAIRKCTLDCLKYLVFPRDLGGDLKDAIEHYQNDDFNPAANVMEITRLMLDEIFDGTLADQDNICITTLGVICDFYHQIYSDPKVICTMVWCSATILYIPTECMGCLCERGKSINVSMFKGCMDTIIALAVVNSHFDCVKRLLGNVQVPSLEMTASALVIAAFKGTVEHLKHLLEISMAHVDVTQNVMQNLLLLATLGGHVECVKYLHDTMPLDVDHHDIYEDTVFMLSAKSGHVECVKHLLGAELIDSSLHNKIGNTAFMLAAMNGHVENIKCLLGTGQIDVNYGNKMGNTAFMLSAMNGHIECLKCLLDTGQIDINHQNLFGNTALNLTIIHGHAECARWVLNTGQVDIKRAGSTALKLSAEYGFVECLKSLLQTGEVDINHPCGNGENAFTLSAANGHVECLKCLLDTGQVDINHHNNVGYSALILSVLNGHVECAKCLLDFEQVNVNSCDEEKLRAIGLAVLNDQLECLGLLFKYLPDNQRVWKRIKATFLSNVERMNYIPHFLHAGFFHWSWYPEFPHNKRFLTRELVIHGYVPRRFEWQGRTSSPLHHAFMINDDGLVRYLIANLYLTPFDVEHFQDDKNLQSHVSLNGSESVKELHRQIFSSPWRLEALSLLKISSLLKNERRENDVAKLDGLLPGCFLGMLGFKTSFQWLCKRRWEHIHVNHMYLVQGRRSVMLDENILVRGKCCTDFCLQF